MSYEPLPEGEFALSPSRVKTADKCGLAYKYHYIDQLPAKEARAATVFGSVIHDSVEQWYGPEQDGLAFRERDLAQIVADRWQFVLPKEVWAYTRRVLEVERELDAVAEAILLARPTLKNPRQTKAFLQSSEYSAYEDIKSQLLQVCERCEIMTWPKDENPVVAYHRSQKFARQMQERWTPLPRPVGIELPFRIDFDGFSLRGRIDQLRCDPNPQTGEVVYEVWDIKTGRNLLSQMDAFLQMWMYDHAMRQDDQLPDPENVVLYHVRSDQPQRGKIDRDRHDRLASSILHGVGRRIALGQFEPHYGMWCSMCDFRDLCEREISLWTPETDGLATP